MAMVAAVLFAGSWWINAAFSPPGWACDVRVTGFDGWPARSTSLEAVLATTQNPPEGAVVHDPERVSDDYFVRQYLLDGEIVQEVSATRTEDGEWGVDSVTTC